MDLEMTFIKDNLGYFPYLSSNIGCGYTLEPPH